MPDKKKAPKGPKGPDKQDINYRLAQLNYFMTFSAKILIKLLDKNPDVLEDLSDKDMQTVCTLRKLSRSVEEFDKKMDKEAAKLVKKAKEDSIKAKANKNKKKKAKKMLTFPKKKKK